MKLVFWFAIDYPNQNWKPNTSLFWVDMSVYNPNEKICFWLQFWLWIFIYKFFQSNQYSKIWNLTFFENFKTEYVAIILHNNSKIKTQIYTQKLKNLKWAFSKLASDLQTILTQSPNCQKIKNQTKNPRFGFG